MQNNYEDKMTNIPETKKEIVLNTIDFMNQFFTKDFWESVEKVQGKKLDRNPFYDTLLNELGKDFCDKHSINDKSFAESGVDFGNYIMSKANNMSEEDLEHLITIGQKNNQIFSEEVKKINEAVKNMPEPVKKTENTAESKSLEKGNENDEKLDDEFKAIFSETEKERQENLKKLETMGNTEVANTLAHIIIASGDSFNDNFKKLQEKNADRINKQKAQMDKTIKEIEEEENKKKMGGGRPSLLNIFKRNKNPGKKFVVQQTEYKKSLSDFRQKRNQNALRARIVQGELKMLAEKFVIFEQVQKNALDARNKLQATLDKSVIAKRMKGNINAIAQRDNISYDAASQKVDNYLKMSPDKRPNDPLMKKAAEDQLKVYQKNKPLFTDYENAMEKLGNSLDDIKGATQSLVNKGMDVEHLDLLNEKVGNAIKQIAPPTIENPLKDSPFESVMEKLEKFTEAIEKMIKSMISMFKMK